jgi:hypothetical protein
MPPFEQLKIEAIAELPVKKSSTSGISPLVQEQKSCLQLIPQLCLEELKFMLM